MLTAVLAGGFVCAGCQSIPAVVGQPGAPPAAAPPVRGVGRDLGALPANTQLHVELTLRGTDPSGAQALLARGGRVAPQQWAQRYGPDPAEAAHTEQVLRDAGLTVEWQPGSVLMPVSGRTEALERFFGVSIHVFARADGARYHAPLRPPTIPGAIAGDVITLTGLDDNPLAAVDAVRGPNGVTPADMLDFYDMMPLRHAGFDGTGITIAFPEWAVPDNAVLNSFSNEFKLPPFDVQVQTDPSWGAPNDPSSVQYYPTAGEAALDLEVVHGLAPGAHEVVYGFSDPSKLPDVMQAIGSQHPGAIISSSISAAVCELDDQGQMAGNPIATSLDAVETMLAMKGISIFWASGDRGAYACIPDGQANLSSTPDISPDMGATGETVVGGTQVFLAAAGGYSKETAWGEPIAQWGSGGGVSTLFSRPQWQQAPGLDSSMTKRAIPDVSGNAGGLSRWDVFYPDPQAPAGREQGVGGTSAATPCWAAITALIDQDLKQKGLPAVGFANPALYLFAQSPPGLPAPAFHDITLGNNLKFPATPGWDMATGLGSPEVAALADDFEWYERSHPSS
jgi:kumamolisin